MTRRLVNDVDDGYIRGRIHAKSGECFNCGSVTRVIWVSGMSLPEEIKGKDGKFPPSLIFLDEKGSTLDRIGIGCGCYAKGHRQVAHIRSKVTKFVPAQ